MTTTKTRLERRLEQLSVSQVAFLLQQRIAMARQRWATLDAYQAGARALRKKGRGPRPTREERPTGPPSRP